MRRHLGEARRLAAVIAALAATLAAALAATLAMLVARSEFTIVA